MNSLRILGLLCFAGAVPAIAVSCVESNCPKRVAVPPQAEFRAAIVAAEPEPLLKPLKVQGDQPGAHELNNRAGW